MLTISSPLNGSPGKLAGETGLELEKLEKGGGSVKEGATETSQPTLD